jgi:hypothetical protein
MINLILVMALALGGASHKPSVKVRKDDPEATKVVWVCKGNSYMMLDKGFKPDKSKKCRKTKIKGESDRP